MVEFNSKVFARGTGRHDTFLFRNSATDLSHLGRLLEKINAFVFDDDDDVYFPLTHYYLQDMNHSNYLQLFINHEELKEL